MMNTTELIIGLIMPTAAAIALAWLLVRRLRIEKSGSDWKPDL